MKYFKIICFCLASSLACFFTACELTGSGGGGSSSASVSEAGLKNGFSKIKFISGNIIELKDGWTLIVEDSTKISKQREAPSCSGFDNVGLTSIKKTDILEYSSRLSDTIPPSRSGVAIEIKAFLMECVEVPDTGDCGCGGTCGGTCGEPCGCESGSCGCSS